MSQHILTPQEDSGKHCFLPSSPRNQLMYFLQNSIESRFCDTVAYLLLYDREEEETVLAECSQEDRPRERRQVKRRRYATREVPLSAEEFCESLSVDSESVKNLLTKKQVQFSEFCQDLISSGVILWRKHSETVQVVVMSDYSPTTGKICPLDFVHVTGKELGGKWLVSCSCSMYKTMEGVALKKVKLHRGEEAVLDSKFSCMHVRLYTEQLHPNRFDLAAKNCTSTLLKFVQNNMVFVNNPVVLLGVASVGGTTKFSVLVDSSECQFVNMHFSRSCCFVKCQKGLCATSPFFARTRVPRAVPMETRSARRQVCNHLETFLCNGKVWRNLFPHFFRQGPTDDQEEADEDEDPDGATGHPHLQNLKILMICPFRA